MATDSKDLTALDADPQMLPGLANLSALRQAGILVGIAASVALGVAVALWAQKPDMRPLGHFSPDALSDVVSYLEQNQVPYELTPEGTLLVADNKFQKVKIELAGQGLLSDGGDDFLKKDSGFGVSQRLEQARLLRSQEMQLARSISQFSGIKAATVHIAMPQKTSFIGLNKKPSASVALSLYSNAKLADEKAQAIVDLVVGAVPGLERDRVAVTDQFGRLYNAATSDETAQAIDKEFKAELKRQKEYEEKIARLLSPILGPENFTVQVSVDLDFTQKEQTQQVFNPDSPAVTEEKTLESVSGEGDVGGVPGALSNQPPAAANIPEAGAPNLQQSTATAGSGKRRIEAQRRFNVDTTISHVKQPIGKIRQLGVAIGVNYAEKPSDTGEAQRVPRSPEELEKIRRLVEGVVGYDPNRGDQVVVDSFDFVVPQALTEPEPLPFYQQPLFKALWKPVVTLLSLLLLILGVLKPMFSKLATPPARSEGGLSPALAAGLPGMTADGQLMLTDAERDDLLPEPARKELEQVKRAKKIAGDDPKMVAALVQNWIEEDND